MKKNILLNLCILSLIVNSCDGFNTATPQGSSSIASSKENGFYLADAKKLSAGKSDIIDSVWVEKVWHYKVIEGEKKKIAQSPNNQIILKLKNTNEVFNKKKYFLEWKI